jgi:signal transduction histidine kinase
MIIIADDGQGFDVAETLLGHEGFGLHTMRERMELVGGTLTIDSAPGRGTRIIARMPRLAQGNPSFEVNGAGDDTHPHPVGR